MKLNFIAILIFLSVAFDLRAQTEIHDTVLLTRYNNLCNRYELESADSLLKYASIQLILANKHHSVFHQIHAYTNLGVAYTRLFQFNDALNCYLSARDVVEKNKRTGVAPLLGQIGYIYLRLNRKKEAYKYFRQQEVVSLKEENYRSYLSSIVNLSDYYNTNNELDSTIAVLHKGLIIARKFNYHENEVIILDNIANAYYAKAVDMGDMKLFKLVEAYADTALVHHLQDKDSSAIYYIYGLLGALNMDLKNYIKAENYYKQYISYSVRTKDIMNLKIGIEEYSRLFALQGKYAEAYKYRVMYDSINRLYIDEETNKQVEELNTRYETQKKEQQNILLKQQNDLSGETIQKQRIIVWFTVLGLIGSLVFTFFIFRIYKQKKRAHQLISKQKEEVEQKQILIENQKQVIEEKQKEIVDSINYAKRIQYALLASGDLLSKSLKEYFVLFKPKDIVSGDFYWATQYKNKFYLAVCDSTGHGVPGAFMSLLNIGFLSEAIKEKEISEANKIFDYVRKRLIESIGSGDQQDGMDGILLCFDLDNSNNWNGQLTYSSANINPVVIRNGEIIEFPKDKMPVGRGQKSDSFKLYTIATEKNDLLFLYTDGYADQFGGPKGKKYKHKPLNEFLKAKVSLPMLQQQQAIDLEFESWKGNLEQVDDVLLIGIKL